MLSLHRKKIEEFHLAEKVVDVFGKNKIAICVQLVNKSV
jgi:hypothetical protein